MRSMEVKLFSDRLREVWPVGKYLKTASLNSNQLQFFYSKYSNFPCILLQKFPIFDRMLQEMVEIYPQNNRMAVESQYFIF